MVDLPQAPSLNSDGCLEVPIQERERAEEAIEIAADLVAVAIRTSRSISSPNPFIALYPESDDERDLLQSTEDLSQTLYGYPLSIVPNLEISHILNLSDRLDGVQVMAEAVSQAHGSGKFRELTRFLERAFGCNYKRLPQPLVQFLERAPHPLGYTHSEVNAWINEYRDRIIHGGSDHLLFGRHVIRAAHRMEQAAYDVLFNKAEWGKTNASRQQALELGGTSSADGPELTIVRGQGIKISSRLFDAFGVFPLHLNSPEFELPEGWWADRSYGEGSGMGGKFHVRAPTFDKEN